MTYGALNTIEPQCNARGYTLGDKRELVDKLHFGLNICHIHGVLTDAEWRKATARLDKLVWEYAVKMEEHEK